MIKLKLKPIIVAISALHLANYSHADEDSITLPKTVVQGKRDIMASPMSADDVYDENESSTYATKEDLERFMGESPADIFKSMVGVQSGDARNSGAIDPNVRGVQGQGRVPVTIDGTEQAITVYRGYSGANNRNYIDPLLISEVKVTKGASLQPEIKSSVGGAVTIKTLNVNDVLAKDSNFGLDIKGVLGNNSTAEQAISYSTNTLYVGDTPLSVNPEQDLYNPDLQKSDPAKQQATKRREAYLNLSGDLPRRGLGGATSKKPEEAASTLNLKDKAIRVAVAGRGKHFDALAAYTYRDRGNYFAGKNGSSDYISRTASDKRSTGDFAAYMADVYKPDAEVPNTSNQTDSYLLKGTYKPTDSQAVQLGIRHTNTTYGDIMPSRVADNRSNSLYSITGRLPQWPLSNVTLNSYNLEYRLKPEKTHADGSKSTLAKWVDLHASLWHTNSTLNTNNSGGFPYFQLGIIGRTARTSFEEYQQGMVAQFKDKFPQVQNCTEAQIRALDTSTLCGQLATLYGSNTLVKADAYMTTHNNRTGFSLSNKAQLTDTLSLSLATNWQKEKLWSEEIQNKLPIGFVALPRKGRRQAWDTSLGFTYQPTKKIDLQAGVTYNNYWVIDDLINERRKQGLSPNKSTRVTGYNLLYYQKANEKVQTMLKAYNKGNVSQAEYLALLKQEYPKANLSIPMIYGRDLNHIEGAEAKTAYMQQQYVWQADAKGNFSRANNPFFNGDATKNGWLPPAKLYQVSENGNTKGSGQAVPIVADVTVGDPFKHAKKHHAWAVTPSVQAAYKFNDYTRLYARYAQATRMPSLYESTLGFSLQSIDNENQVKPEKGSTFEVGFVQDLTKWLADAHHADVKLAYYRNRIDDVIDRSATFKLKNFDYQVIEGVELQSRYDNGDWFGDLSLSHTLKQHVCDAGYAMIEDPYFGQVPKCVKYGFQFGYLQNMGQPDWQVNLTLGKRFLDEKLTLGSRVHYHSGANKEVMANNYGYSSEGTIIFNTPIDWFSAVTLDAFATYKIDDMFNVELSGTNLTNRYYLDPLSRTLMPAPARAFKLKAQAKF